MNLQDDNVVVFPGFGEPEGETQANNLLWNVTLTTPTSCDDILNDSFNSTELELKLLIRAFKDCQECATKATRKSGIPLLVVSSTALHLIIIACAYNIKRHGKSGKICQITLNLRRVYISITDEREPRLNRVNSQRSSNYEESNLDVEDDERSIEDESDTYITPEKRSNNGPDGELHIDRENDHRMDVLKE